LERRLCCWKFVNHCKFNNFTASLDLYKFNIVTQTWSSPYIFTPGGTSPVVQEPFVFAYGGFAILVDESNPTVMYYIDSNAAASSSWTSITIASNPLLLNRLDQRFLVWGSQIYMFGGYVPSSSPTTPSVQYNDLWVINLSQALLGNGAAWSLVSPPGDPTTGLVAGFPPPRIGYTWTPYQVGAIMFGGLSTSKQGEDVLYYDYNALSYPLLTTPPINVFDKK